MNAERAWISVGDIELCVRSGRLRTRAVPTERTLARVWCEAGASVRCNAKLREMNIAVSASRPSAAYVNGAVLAAARHDKAAKH